MSFGGLLLLIYYLRFQMCLGGFLIVLLMRLQQNNCSVAFFSEIKRLYVFHFNKKSRNSLS